MRRLRIVSIHHANLVAFVVGLIFSVVIAGMLAHHRIPINAPLSHLKPAVAVGTDATADYPIVHLHCKNDLARGDDVYLNYTIGQVTLATGGWTKFDFSGKTCNIRQPLIIQGYYNNFENADMTTNTWLEAELELGDYQ